MIIDTHCHYNLLENTAWQAAWRLAQDHGVEAAIIAGVATAENARGIAISRQEPHLKAAIGFHPENYTIEPALSEEQFMTRLVSVEQDISSLVDMLPENVIAIGEIGLDYFRLPADPVAARQTRQLQQHAFIQQLKVAQTAKLPMLLHVRDSHLPETPTADNAYWDVLRILREYLADPVPFVLHCVSGPLSYVKAAIELGAYIGVAGNVTYNNADHIRSLVRSTPPDRLLLETDAPFLPPIPHRGKPCEPWMISLTGKYLAEEMNSDLQDIYDNTVRLFPAFRDIIRR